MSDPKLLRWQSVTVGTLLIGYSGYYLCRSNLSVAGPLLIAEFEPVGFNKVMLGSIFSWGITFYTIGKLFNGILCDFLGGRRMFLFGMVASVVCTVAFGLAEGFAAFVVIWSTNRLVQSMGWGALVKVASRWFPMRLHGTIMGILCLSYLFGDSASRFFLGRLIKADVGWRGLFFVAAGVLGTIAVANLFLLKSSPRDVGAEEPTANPANVYGARGDEHRPESLITLLGPFVRSPSFWLVCVISFGLTLIRETFNSWTPVYLTEVVNMKEGSAGMASALFPFVGGLSVLAAGFLTDRVGGGRRGTIIVPFLLLLILALGTLSQQSHPTGPLLPLALIAAVAFLMIGPYSFLTGVMSLDLGGKQGSSTAAGLVDTAGYLGGIFSGVGIGAIAQHSGWSSAFGVLTAAALVTGLAAVAYWVVRDLRGTSTAAPTAGVD